MSIDSLNFVTVDWVVFYNGTQSAVITEVYALFGGNGVYTLELNLFCPNRASQNVLKVSDQIYYSSDLVGAVFTSGLAEESVGASIYPVPFINDLHIELSKVDNYDVVIYDVTGKLILRENIVNTNQIKLQLNNIEKGQYIVVIKDDNQVITQKIIK